METMESEKCAKEKSLPNEVVATLPINSEQTKCAHPLTRESDLPTTPSPLNVDEGTNTEFKEMKTENGNIEPEEDSFYSIAAQYWSQVPPTVDGMLGGFGFVSHTDIQGSDSFLSQIFKLKHPPHRERALDCGAGIGRVTKLLLQRHFKKVDLVEQNPAFLKEARSYLGPSKKIGELFCSGLQNFRAEEGAYDVIWCQWVLGHLTDEDLVEFMHASVRGLREGGVIVVKENVTSSGELEQDDEDSSVTRSEQALVALLEGPAGLVRVREMKQPRFPKSLYPVRMYALRPQAIIASIEQQP